ncbi:MULTISPECIES: ABC transporter substrate-binding protein [unclassified Duganella]|uniref:substrate-binding periplasmic protein n=1 Tax=unclassified Duganella TaxID=2636909 RepID=UPI00131467A1|nr:MULTISPECIES: transporter substrate-binding domain-containing protein [unclassified Duganella]
MKGISLLALVLLGACATVACAAGPALELHIVHRPPYLVVGPNVQVSGLSVEPVTAAFEKAHIAVVWREMPALRQLALLRKNSGKFCSVGWYKTPEREKFAKYSNPVSQDGPWVAVVSSRFPHAAATVDDILSDANMTVLVKEGFVYGSYLDNKFSTMKAARMTTAGEMPQLFNMIAAGRADVIFAPKEEAEYYLAHGVMHAGQMRIITFKEMPQGYYRHLMCSLQVDDSDIARFNAALIVK